MIRLMGYDVTADGRVFSIRSNGQRRELAQHINSNGYASVRVFIDGKLVRKTVHRLVALKFLPAPPSPTHEARHLDGTRTNSNVANLAWGTSAENSADRERHGRTFRGERHSDLMTPIWASPEFRVAHARGIQLHWERVRAGEIARGQDPRAVPWEIGPRTGGVFLVRKIVLGRTRARLERREGEIIRRSTATRVQK